MSPTALRINGTTLHADLSGGLFDPATRSLAVADLHLAKGSGFAERGVLLPPYDVRATLTKLRAVIAKFRPDRVICLGDSFDDERARGRLHADDLKTLRTMTGERDWIWIAGNHDPRPPCDVGGRAVFEFAAGAVTYRHEATRKITGEARAGEISGHFHPKASCHVRGRRISERCFVSDGHRAVLPAFGAYTGGLDVLDPSISALFPGGFEVLMLGMNKLHRLADKRLGAAGRNFK